MSKKKIMWLEDHPDLSPYIPDLVKQTNLNIVTCSNLEEFQLSISKLSNEPDKVAGFIIDVAISGAIDLSVLDLQRIKTHQGTVTGIQVILYLLGLLDLDNKEHPFAQLPILALTVLENPENTLLTLSCPSPYDSDNTNISSALSKVAFITKDIYSPGSTLDRKIKEWLSSLSS